MNKDILKQMIALTGLRRYNADVVIAAKVKEVF